MPEFGYRWLVAGLAAVSLSTLADDSRGPELLLPFKQQLMHALQKGLRDGPTEAIEACKIRGPELASELSRAGVVMGRSSHRLRNPANAPPAWVRPVLQSYLDKDTPPQPIEIPLDGGRHGYIEPILMQAPCLMCHGSALAPEIAERIADLYPGDRAAGFDLGDLRGVFWVSYGPR